MAVATAGEGGARIQGVRRKARSLARRVARVPSAFLASRSCQQHSDRELTSQRNGKSYTHGGPHAQAPSGDVQPSTGAAAHLPRSNGSATLVPFMFGADQSRSAAGAAASSLARDAAMLEVRAGRQVYRRSCLTAVLSGRALPDRAPAPHGRQGGRSGFCAPPPFACIPSVYIWRHLFPPAPAAISGSRRRHRNTAPLSAP